MPDDGKISDDGVTATSLTPILSSLHPGTAKPILLDAPGCHSKDIAADTPHNLAVEVLDAV